MFTFLKRQIVKLKTEVCQLNLEKLKNLERSINKIVIKKNNTNQQFNAETNF